jgi:hypothetical protein
MKLPNYRFKFESLGNFSLKILITTLVSHEYEHKISPKYHEYEHKISLKYHKYEHKISPKYHLDNHPKITLDFTHKRIIAGLSQKLPEQ